MQLKNCVCLVALLVLVLTTALPILEKSQASESQSIEFEIFSFGDLSGYKNETYIVVRTEAEWADVWEKHTAPDLPDSPYPTIDFSEKMVLCAFMGRRPTTGYSISADKMWTDGERMNVEITKRSPSEDFAVSQVLTHPYVFISFERVDMEIVVHVTEETGDIIEHVLPEIPTIAPVLILVILSGILIIARSRRKTI